jgi:hypothetical protein
MIRDADTLDSELNNDLNSDLIALQTKLINSIDPYIRRKILKKGISIIQNVYTGFDTEYENIDSETNRLLSVQIASTSRCILKIPVLNINAPIMDDEIPHEKVSIPEKGIKKNVFNELLFINSLNYNIRSYRRKFNKYDSSLEDLVNGLKTLSQLNPIKYKITNGEHFFMFPTKPIKTSIFMGEEFSSVNLVTETEKLVKDDLSKEYGRILILLRGIYKRKEVAFLEDNGDFKDLYKPYGTPLLIDKPTESNGDEYKKGVILTRSKMSSFTQDFVNVNRPISYYLIAHLTSADLSLLKDFDELKEELNIVNGNFVTVGKPIKIKNKKVFIRDTMLLTPAGNRSLDSIGRLYETPKIDIGNYDKSDMRSLMIADKKLFIDYAIRDSVITLMHACTIEEFRFDKIGKIGIPLTLSALGTEYVLAK